MLALQRLQVEGLVRDLPQRRDLHAPLVELRRQLVLEIARVHCEVVLQALDDGVDALVLHVAAHVAQAVLQLLHAPLRRQQRHLLLLQLAAEAALLVELGAQAAARVEQRVFVGHRRELLVRRLNRLLEVALGRLHRGEPAALLDRVGARLAQGVDALVDPDEVVAQRLPARVEVSQHVVLHAQVLRHVDRRQEPREVHALLALGDAVEEPPQHRVEHGLLAVDEVLREGRLLHRRGLVVERLGQEVEELAHGGVVLLDGEVDARVRRHDAEAVGRDLQQLVGQERVEVGERVGAVEVLVDLRDDVGDHLLLVDRRRDAAAAGVAGHGCVRVHGQAHVHGCAEHFSYLRFFSAL